MKAPQTHLFKGKVIDRVDWRPFDDGRGSVAHNPIIIFTDGSALQFVVEETDVGEYGVYPAYNRKGTHNSTTLTAVFVSWTEYERGWGCRPDGCSVHVSMEEWKHYYEEYKKRLPKDVPDEYSAPGKPQLITITDQEIVSDLLEKKSRRYWNGDKEQKILQKAASL